MKKRSHLASLALVALLAAAVTPGCLLRQQQEEEDVQLAEDAAALNWEGTRSSGLTRALLSPLDASDTEDADKAATALETKPVAGFYPAGCVTVARDGASAHIEFDDCTGPFGLVHLKGGMDATFTLGAESLHVEIVDSGDVTVQDRPAHYAAAADVTLSEVGYDMDWTASWTGTLSTGETFTHASDLDISVDPATQCVVLSGTAEGRVGERGLDSVIDGYAVCPLACPSGGTITSTGKSSGHTVVVEFNGTSAAEVTWPSGATSDVGLVCSADR